MHLEEIVLTVTCRRHRVGMEAGEDVGKQRGWLGF